MKEKTYEVTMKHTNEVGAVLWERTVMLDRAEDDDMDLDILGDRAVLKWAGGVVVIYLRPGERLEAVGKDLGEDE